MRQVAFNRNFFKTKKATRRQNATRRQIVLPCLQGLLHCHIKLCCSASTGKRRMITMKTHIMLRIEYQQTPKNHMFKLFIYYTFKLQFQLILVLIWSRSTASSGKLERLITLSILINSTTRHTLIPIFWSPSLILPADHWHLR